VDSPERATLSSRKTERTPVAADARLRQGFNKCMVEVVDLSATGLRIKTADQLQVGDVVWITLPSLAPLEVRIVWFRDWEAGCEFVNPLHPAVADAVAARSRKP
jgi:hypothetical protein